MTQSSGRSWFVAAVLTMGSATGCSGGHATSGDGAGGFWSSAGGDASTAEGGRTTANGGSSTTGGTGGTGTGGATSGGSASGGADGGTASAGAASGGAGNGGATTGGATAARGGSAGAGGAVPGCTESPRRIGASLEFPEGMTAPTAAMIPTTSGVLDYQVEGTLQSVSAVTDPCATCPGGELPRLALTIVDAANKIWTLKAGPPDRASGWQAATKAVEGSPVSLLFRYARGFQFVLSTGFVLSDAQGPVIISDQAEHVTALRPADLPGFSVSRGAALCSVPSSGCGPDRYYSLVFSGSTTATVDLASDGEFVIGSRTYVARNMGAAAITGNRCIDAEVGSPWAVWRAPN